jgi:hypothetical protein
LPWAEIVLVAAGAVPHVEIGTMATPHGTNRAQLETRLHFTLALVTATHHYEIHAHRFAFPAPPSPRPLSLAERLVPLIRDIATQTPHAQHNRAVRDIHDGVNLIRGYPSCQSLRDEMTWLLWRRTQSKRAGSLGAGPPK